MEKIIQHIEKLLIHNDYVVVPSLGGFMTQQHKARFENDNVYAPYCNVAFNALMHHSDGLLVIEVSRSMQISYREAQEYVDKTVNNIHKQLKQGKRVSLGQLGELALGTEGQIIFEPSHMPLFLPGNTGYNVINLKKFELEATNSKHIRFNATKITRYAAAVALVMSLQFGFDKLSKPTYEASILNLNFNESKIITPKVINKTVENLKPSVADSSLYHVVVASLPSEQAATNYAFTLQKDSFPDAHVIKPSSMYRVAIKSFKSKDEAIAYMETLRLSDERFASAWVLCKK